jgi:MTH538 TIR-like domain (DUF1863)
MGRISDLRYDAFITYSHKFDRERTAALQKALHTFAKPWYRLRALHVFRDETSLSATPSLWSDIRAALSESEHLILVGSPESAQSKWVHRELECWLEEFGRPPERLMIIVTGGTISWDDSQSDFDWNATTAIPTILRGRFASEPLWVDLTWAQSSDQLSLRHPRFRNVASSLAATLHRTPKDELDGEDVRQHHRTKFILKIGLSVLITLAARGENGFA